MVEDATAGPPPASADENSARIIELSKKATAQYALKNFTEASDLYSEACQLQDEVNGEMAPENAELLFLYGRALFKVAVAKSDVLGGRVAGEKKQKKNQTDSAAAGAAASDALVTSEQKLADDVVEAAIDAKDAPEGIERAEKTVDNQPYFEITGMENWDDEDEEDDAEDGADGEAEEEEDEFVIAFEILDTARVLLEKQLNALRIVAEPDNSMDKGKTKANGDSSLDANERHIKERLSDIHDLQAEIALEGERFLDAIPDTRAALALKRELFTEDHNLVAEAHFKLSLALEFAAMTKIRQAQAQEGDQARISAEDVDESMRDEAREQQEHAIASCKLRLSKEEASLDSAVGEEKEKKVKSIAEVKEIIEEMEIRLADLRGPAVSLAFGPAGAPPLGGAEQAAADSIFAQHLGETAQEQKERIEAAKKTATDLTKLVRHKKPKPDGVAQGTSRAPATASETTSNGTKRKAEVGEDGKDGEDGAHDKKVKFEV